MLMFLMLILLVISIPTAQAFDIEGMLESYNALKVGGLGAILSMVYQVLKSNKTIGILNKLNPNIHPWLILLIGSTLNVMEAVAASGKPVWIALIEGSVIGAVAMGVHDTARTMKKGKKDEITN